MSNRKDGISRTISTKGRTLALRGFLWILPFTPFLLSANPVFNGSFELGTNGFAIERHLRPDTNPKLEFLPLKTVQEPSGSNKNVLKIENPYSEFFAVFSKEFQLNPDTSYRASFRMKSTKRLTVNCRIFQVYRKWLAYGDNFSLTDQWKEYSFTFKTEKKNGNGWYHFNIQLPNKRSLKKADIFIDDLRVDEEAQPQTESVDAVAVPDKTLYTRGDTAKTVLKCHNPLNKPFEGKLKVTVTDEYTAKQMFRKEIPVKLAAGEGTEIALPDQKLDRIGGFRVTVAGEELRTVDSFFAVFGPYDPKPIDIMKDPVVSFNGVCGYQIPPKVMKPGYHVLNTGYTTQTEILSRLGCRLMRDHDGGVRIADWPALEPEQGKIDYTLLDTWLNLYEKHHITLLPVIGHEFLEVLRKTADPRWPEWVKPLLIKVTEESPSMMEQARGHVVRPPIDIFREYIRRTVTHAKGRIPAYEFMNEPVLYLPGRIYTEYLKMAAETIRKCDPSAKILGFCLTGDHKAKSFLWLEQCGAESVKIPDIVSFHPYNARQLGSLVPADENIAGLRDRMKKYGRPDIPIWNTEVYYLREKKPEFDYLDEREVPPHLAACRFLTDVGEGLGQSIALNLSQIWKRVLTPNARYVKNYHQLIPSETMVAYNALARLFERSHAVKKIRFPEGAICYIYRKDGALIAAVWNYKKIKGLKADLSAFEVMDLFGNPEKPGEKPLADAPFYLTQGKLTDQEFIDMLLKLPLRLDRPVFPGELARLAGNKLFVMLINNSDKKQFGQAGVNGGLIADDPVRFTVEPRSSIVLQIPVSEGEKGKKTNLVLYHEKNLFRIPLNIVRNTLIDGSFKLENASGKISFGKEMIRVEMNVSDPSEAKNSDSVKPWETDCVELFFDTEPLHLPYQFAQAYLPTTFRLFVTPRGQKKLHVIGKIDPEKCKLDLKQTPEGYSFTLEIPVQTKKYLGFGVQIDDFDGTRLRQIATGKDMFDHRCNFGIAEAK